MKRLRSRLKIFLDRTPVVASLKGWTRRTLGIRRYEAVARVLFPKARHRTQLLGRPILGPREGDARLRDAILGARPFAAGKIGASELRGILEHRRVSAGGGRTYSEAIRHELATGPGVFPTDPASIARWVGEYEASIRALDLLSVWHNSGEEEYLASVAPTAEFTGIEVLNPFAEEPFSWFGALRDRTVLAVSPFAGSIERQHPHREEIWSGHPVFATPFRLRTLRTPLSAALAKPVDADWVAALRRLEAEMAAIDFDVALVGAGAFSLPLAARARALGKVGIHLGGTTQVVWGVLGKRFENNAFLASFTNSRWCRPAPDETPERAGLVEDGCYW